MSLAAALLFLTASMGAAPAPGTFVDSAQVTVTVLKPIAVRQATGPVEQQDLPIYQLSRRPDAILVEFE